MEHDANYVAKGRFGRESPIKTMMSVKITNPNRKDRPTMCDITFYSYYNVIGSKYYCAYKISDDILYFKFFDKSENDIHRYKMFPASSKKIDFIDGNPVTINVINKLEMLKFVSPFSYPVYYNNSTNEYFIKLADKRTRLFDATTKKHTRKEESAMANMKLVEIDGEKLGMLIKTSGHTNKEISLKCGRNENYITTILRSNKIDPAIMQIIETCFNIPSDLYKISDRQENMEPNVKFTDDVKQELYKIIYTAVYEAVKKVLSE